MSSKIAPEDVKEERHDEKERGEGPLRGELIRTDEKLANGAEALTLEREGELRDPNTVTAAGEGEGEDGVRAAAGEEDGERNNRVSPAASVQDASDPMRQQPDSRHVSTNWIDDDETDLATALGLH